MQILLLAAGLGTRLRPITDHIPKCLVEINGRPLLDYWMELLSDTGDSDVAVNLHYFPEQVQRYLAQCTFPMKIRTLYEERLLGTAGTVRKHFADLQEPLMLVHADNLSLFDMAAFQQCFASRAGHVEITMMTFETDMPETCGIVELDENGVVQAFHEKVKNPPSNLANGAVYILTPKVIEFISSFESDFVDFSTEVLPHFMGRINTFCNTVYHRDIGNPASLAAACEEYPHIAEQYRLANGIVSHRG